MYFLNFMMRSGLILVGILGGSSFAHAALFDRDGNRVADSEYSNEIVNWWVERPTQNSDVRAIGWLFPKNCTATIIQQSSGAPLYLLTAGHCVPSRYFSAASEQTIRNVPIEGNYSFVPALCDEAISQCQIQVPVTKIVYASKRERDIALYEIDLTPARAQELGIAPYQLSSLPANRGDAVSMISIPAEAIPESQVMVRRGNCRVLKYVDLVEGRFETKGAGAFYCSATGGSSGAPVVMSGTNAIVGVLSTGASSAAGDLECGVMHPCEISASGTRMVGQFNYFVPVFDLASCFNELGQFSFDQSSCLLKGSDSINAILSRGYLDFDFNNVVSALSSVRDGRSLVPSAGTPEVLRANFSPEYLEVMTSLRRHPQFVWAETQIREVLLNLFGEADLVSVSPTHQGGYVAGYERNLGYILVCNSKSWVSRF
jgi:hypothetical protein